MDGSSANQNVTRVEVAKEHEFRFEVEFEQTVTIKVSLFLIIYNSCELKYEIGLERFWFLLIPNQWTPFL
jgi:hypothetical protein